MGGAITGGEERTSALPATLGVLFVVAALVIGGVEGGGGFIVVTPLLLGLGTEVVEGFIEATRVLPSLPSVEDDAVAGAPCSGGKKFEVMANADC